MINRNPPEPAVSYWMLGLEDFRAGRPVNRQTPRAVWHTYLRGYYAHGCASWNWP